MPARKPAAADVEAFLRQAAHPLDATVRALRAVITATDPRIGEDIKWNAPSFHLDGRHFATMQLRRNDRVLLVLHLGAKPGRMPGETVADPARLLTWLAPDRATMAFDQQAQVPERAAAVQAVLRQWMARV